MNFFEYFPLVILPPILSMRNHHHLFYNFILLSLSLSAMDIRTVAASRRHEQRAPSLPKMETAMYYPEFWISRTASADRILMAGSEIRDYNRRAFAADCALTDMGNIPERLPGASLLRLIRESSPVPRYPKCYDNGTLLRAEDYRMLQAAMNLAAVSESVSVRWALSVRRCELRTFPDHRPVHRPGGDREQDLFLETGVTTGEILAVLHTSGDGRWHFVQCFNYAGWVAADDLAFGSREAVFGYRSRSPRLVITGSKVLTAFVPGHPDLSRRILDMGDSLPLTEAPPEAISGMGTDGNWTVDLPVRTRDGNLTFHPVLISRSSDVNIGFLPFTRSNLIRQAFKLQGERYSWGDKHGNRDCSGFIISVYRSFGIVLPRNSGDQMKIPGSKITLQRHPGTSVTPASLSQLQPGDILPNPSHVMLYLGEYNGEHYVIHDTMRGTCPKQNGGFHTLLLRQISVTPMLSIRYADGHTLADSFPIARRIAWKKQPLSRKE